VKGAFGTFWAPEDAHTFNPAFDVTPVDFVTSLVLDTGIITQEEMKQGKLRTLEKKK